MHTSKIHEFVKQSHFFDILSTFGTKQNEKTKQTQWHRDSCIAGPLQTNNNYKNRYIEFFCHYYINM